MCMNGFGYGEFKDQPELNLLSQMDAFENFGCVSCVPRLDRFYMPCRLLKGWRQYFFRKGHHRTARSQDPLPRIVNYNFGRLNAKKFKGFCSTIMQRWGGSLTPWLTNAFNLCVCHPCCIVFCYLVLLHMTGLARG